MMRQSCIVNLYRTSRMQLNKGIVYAWQESKKINGSLFYCIEYYLEIRRHTDINLYILDISDEDLKELNNLIQEKYIPDVDIIQIKRTRIPALNLDKILVLDIKTFKKIKDFHKGEFLVFANETYHEKHQNVTFYGSYDYQLYDIFCILKLGLNDHRPVTQGDKCFVSCLDFGLFDYREIEDFYKSKGGEKEFIFKKLNRHHKNLFNEISEVLYIHISLEKNNRVIPEAFYHGKKCYLMKRYLKKDSAQIRYDDCMSGNLDKYILTADCRIVQDMIKD